jgi:hypothetical protein
MKNVTAFADRIAEPALRLIAALNMLLLASFLFMLMLATGQARAERQLAGQTCWPNCGRPIRLPWESLKRRPIKH